MKIRLAVLLCIVPILTAGGCKDSAGGVLPDDRQAILIFHWDIDNYGAAVGDPADTTGRLEGDTGGLYTAAKIRFGVSHPDFVSFTPEGIRVKKSHVVIGFNDLTAWGTGSFEDQVGSNIFRWMEEIDADFDFSADHAHGKKIQFSIGIRVNDIAAASPIGTLTTGSKTNEDKVIYLQVNNNNLNDFNDTPLPPGLSRILTAGAKKSLPPGTAGILTAILDPEEYYTRQAQMSLENAFFCVGAGSNIHLSPPGNGYDFTINMIRVEYVE